MDDSSKRRYRLLGPLFRKAPPANAIGPRGNKTMVPGSMAAVSALRQGRAPGERPFAPAGARPSTPHGRDAYDHELDDLLASQLARQDDAERCSAEHEHREWCRAKINAAGRGRHDNRAPGKPGILRPSAGIGRERAEFPRKKSYPRNAPPWHVRPCPHGAKMLAWSSCARRCSRTMKPPSIS